MNQEIKFHSNAPFFSYSGVFARRRITFGCNGGGARSRRSNSAGKTSHYGHNGEETHGRDLNR